MMEVGIIDIIVQQGGLFGLAVFALWMLNRTYQDRLKVEDRHAQEIEEMRRATMEALNRNTEAMIRLTERLDS